MQRVNRPVSPINIEAVLNSFQQFREMFPGELGIQTMILSPWSSEQKEEYVRWVKAMTPTEIQLNTPTRPKPLKHELAGRENHTANNSLPYQARQLKCVSSEVLKALAEDIQQQTGIPVRYR